MYVCGCKYKIISSAFFSPPHEGKCCLNMNVNTEYLWWVNSSICVTACVILTGEIVSCPFTVNVTILHSGPSYCCLGELIH